MHWLALKQGSVKFLSGHPMEVLLAERTSDEENQEISAVISKCRNTGEKVSPASAFTSLFSVRHRHSGIRVTPVLLVMD